MRRSILTLYFCLAAAAAHDGHGKKNAPESAKALKSPLTAAQANPELGKGAYQRVCAACHDADGQSKSKAKLKPAPTNLVDHRMDSMKDGEIYWVVTNGIAKTMPAFQKQLNDVERWQVVNYVRFLRGKHKVVSNAKK